MSTSQSLAATAGAATRSLRERLGDPLLTGITEYRALRYVWLLNDYGYRPTIDEVTAYCEGPDRRQPVGSKLFQSLMKNLPDFGPPALPGESVFDYLKRLRWVKEGGDSPVLVAVTPLGRTLCLAVEARAAAEGQDRAVVLDPQDPFAYAKFVDQLGQLSDVLLVDPYLRLPELIELHPVGSIRRILIGGKLPAAERQLLALALRGVPEIEVRVSEEPHDRFLIPPVGDLWQLGASVNGIGGRISVMSKISGDPAQRLREAHESMWERAQKLAPSPEKPASQGQPVGEEDGEMVP